MIVIPQNRCLSVLFDQLVKYQGMQFSAQLAKQVLHGGTVHMLLATFKQIYRQVFFGLNDNIILISMGTVNSSQVKVVNSS